MQTLKHVLALAFASVIMLIKTTLWIIRHPHYAACWFRHKLPYSTVKGALLALVLLAVINFGFKANAQILGPTNGTATAIGDVFKFLGNAGTNLGVSAYGLYDLTTKTAGAGVAADYQLNPYLGAVLRLDYINKDVYMPQGNIQLQFPIAIGKAVFVPFTFAGVGTALGGKGARNGDILYVASVGAAVRITSHFDILGAYERWTGAGFNDDVIALGGRWKF